MVYNGFRFGIFLQLAVGPVCLFIFNTAATFGFLTALSGVMAVVIVDGLEIIFSILGISVFINKYKIAKSIFKYLGIIVLLVFGLNNILSAFNNNAPILMNANSFSQIFLFTFILTLSNPLTVVFWTGIFSAKIAQEKLQKTDLYKFGLGCMLATLAFLSLVCFAGSISHNFLPLWLISLLNILVGLLMIVFAVRIHLFKK